MEGIVKELRKNLFEHNREKIVELIIKAIDKMNSNIEKLSQKQILIYGEAMTWLEDFFIKGDYLTVSDIIKYELLPIFEEEKEDNANI